MKRFWSLILSLLLLVSTLTGCGAKKEPDGTNPPAYSSVENLLELSWEEIEAAAKEEGTLTFAVWSDETEWNQIGELFTKKYGIKVNILAGEKATVMDKVLTELSGKASVDVMFLSGETVTGLIGSNAIVPGILGKMQEKNALVEGLSARKEGVSNEKGYWVPISTSPAGLLYNADHLSKDTVPQTFEELTEFIEANPGRFAMCIPENGGTGQGMMEAIIANLTGGLDQYLIAEDGCKPDLLEKWSVVWDWFDEHKKNITFTTNNMDGITRLNSGEVWLTAAWNSNVYASERNGDLTINHGFYVPDFGICYSGEVMSVVSNSVHPAAALLFINWMTSKEGQTAQAEIQGGLTARTDLQQDICKLSDEDRAKNLDWMAACYKTQYIKDFTANVLS